MMSEIICIGEALIDFKSHTSGFPLEYIGFPGGSPFNVAIAAARLGANVGFVGQISTDMFGESLLEYLHGNAVNTDFVTRGNTPSTLGFVDERPNSVRWTFNNLGTADTQYHPVPRPVLPSDTKFIAFGSISLLQEPSASSISDIVQAHHTQCTIIFDPNCRPSLIKNQKAYRIQMETWLGLTHILKLSSDDLAWLEPNLSLEAAAQHFLAQGCQVVIITQGAAGATLFTRVFTSGIHVTAPFVDVVDTVGAGDTFTAGLMVALLEQSNDMDFDQNTWLNILQFATKAAVLNCTRAGANPPTRKELLEANL
jgi:fructokinase